VLNMGRCIKGYSDVLSLDIVPSESFTQHELPALLGTPLVDGYMEMKLANVDLLTYLCGTTTNIWLRPVQEDLSMTACLEHSASNP
jgi:hypothetical protein